jgi:hypothetical protein
MEDIIQADEEVISELEELERLSKSTDLEDQRQYRRLLRFPHQGNKEMARRRARFAQI